MKRHLNIFIALLLLFAMSTAVFAQEDVIEVVPESTTEPVEEAPPPDPTDEPAPDPTSEPTPEPTTEVIQQAPEAPAEQVAPATGAGSQGDIGTQAYAGTYNTRWSIQNLGAAAANGSIALYPKSSGTAQQTLTFNGLGAGGAKHYGPSDITATSFDGSAVVQADQDMAAVVRLEVLSTGTGKTNVAYATGYSSSNISSTLYIPPVYQNFFGFNSEFSIQNASNGSVDVTIQMIDETGVKHTVNQTIANPGQVERFDMANYDANLSDGNAGFPTSGGWTGFIKLTATGGNIAAQAMAYNTRAGRNDLFLHDAVPTGSTLNATTGKYEAFAPTAYKNVFGNGFLGWGHSMVLVDISGAGGTMNCTVNLNPTAGNTTQTSHVVNLAVTFYKAAFTGIAPEFASVSNDWAGTMNIACDREFAGSVNLSYRLDTLTNRDWVATYEYLSGGGTSVFYPDTRGTGNTDIPGWSNSLAIMNLGTKAIDITIQGFNKDNATGTADWTLDKSSNATAAGLLGNVQPGGGAAIWLSDPPLTTAGGGTVPTNFQGSVKLTATHTDGSGTAGVKLHGNSNTFDLTTATYGDGMAVYSGVAK